MRRRHAMPTEDHSSDRSHQGLPQGGVELSLDELAKGLASGTLSRGKAIRWMGGALGRGRPMLRRADSLWREVRQPADQRAPLWQLLQPLSFNPDLLQG